MASGDPMNISGNISACSHCLRFGAPRLCGARRDAHQRELFLSDFGDDLEHSEGFPAALDQLLHRWDSVWAKMNLVRC